ncbi:MAG: protein translocase subunit SecD [Kofleriaceae bacterium]
MSLRARTILLIAAILACIGVLLPNVVDRDRLPWPLHRFKPLGLGLDLRGGSHIVYSLDLDRAVADRAQEIRRDLEGRYAQDASLTTKPTIKTPQRPIGAVTIVVPPGGNKAALTAALHADYGDTIEMRACSPTDGDAICIQVSSRFAEGIKKAALANAVNTIRDRIDEKGVAEPTVVQKDDQIVVELPGLDEARKQETRDIIARTAKLEFKVVDDGSDFMRRVFAHVGSSGEDGAASDPAAIAAGIRADIDQWTPDEGGTRHTDYFLYAQDRTAIEKYLANLAQQDPSFQVPDDREIAFELVEPQPGAKDREPFWRTYYLERAVKLTGTSIQNATGSYDPNTNRPIVLLDFNRYGSRVFGDLTAQIVGKKLATILDDKVKSAPIINGAIRGGRASITMGGSDIDRQEHERDELVNVLKTGSLPAPLHEEAVSDLGPTLGRDAIEKTRVSFILGVVLVVIIMVAFYRKSGWVAVFAVMFHVLVTLAVMAVFEATLTLPGIAALVLSVGMCVDGNILINERIRDELLLGKSVRGAIELGFSRAFTAIVDGQLTIAASAFVLLQYGSGPIKGFAVMMLVGVFTTVTTNTWVTRVLFDLGTRRNKNATTLSI